MGWRLRFGCLGEGVPASDDGADDLRVDGISVSGRCGPEVSAGFGSTLFGARSADHGFRFGSPCDMSKRARAAM